MIVTHARASKSRRTGFAAILGITCMGLIGLILAAVLALTLKESKQVQNEERRLQAAWLVQAGVEYARAQLERNPAYTGGAWTPQTELTTSDAGQIEISVNPVPDSPRRRTVQVQANYPAQGTSRTRASSTFTVTLPTPAESEDSP